MGWGQVGDGRRVRHGLTYFYFTHFTIFVTQEELYKTFSRWGDVVDMFISQQECIRVIVWIREILEAEEIMEIAEQNEDAFDMRQKAIAKQKDDTGRGVLTHAMSFGALFLYTRRGSAGMEVALCGSIMWTMCNWLPIHAWRPKVMSRVVLGAREFISQDSSTAFQSQFDYAQVKEMLHDREVHDNVITTTKKNEVLCEEDELGSDSSPSKF
ncbi:hypothetical protein RIF29_11116 [Crotalaria pallida]|uniref:RRM domain-containing protein n=1 Tax=Crotalaria pallida TaxID=3830 RepID=A0AAN9FWR3_CROPI